jgi:hypothetical protein
MSIRARDVRVNVAEMGFERGVVHTLEAAIEEINALRVNMRDAIQVIQAMTDNIGNMIQVGTGLQQRIIAMERNTKEDDNE